MTTQSTDHDGASAHVAEPIDGTGLLVDALRLNGVRTIYGVVGIPVTDVARVAQRKRHPVRRIPPRASRRPRRRCGWLLDAAAGHLPHHLRAGLPERPGRARQRDHQLLPHDPDQRVQRPRDRRPAAGRLRGAGPARCGQAARQGGVPSRATRGHRDRRRPGDSHGTLRQTGRGLPRPARRRARAGASTRKRGGDRSSRSSTQRPNSWSRRPPSTGRSTCCTAPRGR